MRPRISSMVTTIIAASALALTLGVNSASATDPPSTPRPSDVVGVGSDTAQDVMSLVGPTLALSGYGPNINAVSPPTVKVYGFDALGSATIVPTQGCAAITRPNGSSAGISALLADEAAGTNCIDYARSSRAKKTDGTDGDLVFVPYAQDGVTWASFAQTPGGTVYNAPVNLTTAQLNSIYLCTVSNWNQVGGKNAPITPFLPQSGSGTRSFFLSAIGVTTPGPCVQQPATLEENNGAAIPAADKPNAILPYSIAKYIAQTNGVSTDNRGGARLGNIDGKKPLTAGGTLNTAFAPAFLRQIFNVLKPADLPSQTFTKIFGKNGYICTHPAIARTFGFAAPLSGGQCGY